MILELPVPKYGIRAQNGWIWQAVNPSIAALAEYSATEHVSGPTGNNNRNGQHD